MAPGLFSTPQPLGCGLAFSVLATPKGLGGAKKVGGHPTYQHQPICSFLTLYRLTTRLLILVLALALDLATAMVFELDY